MNNGDKAINATVNGYLNQHSEYVDNEDKGLTKREYFAGLAMAALLSTDSVDTHSAFAGSAVKMADALLKELDK